MKTGKYLITKSFSSDFTLIRTSISSSSTNDQSVKINNSKKIVIDPMFIRQALFHPSNNTANPVQFQVKL